MSVWEDRLRRHPVHSSLRDLRNALPTPDELDGVAARESLDRLETAVILMSQALIERDPALWPATVLDRWHSAVVPVAEALAALRQPAPAPDGSTVPADPAALDRAVDDLLHVVLPWHAGGLDAAARIRATGDGLIQELTIRSDEQVEAIGQLADRVGREAAEFSRRLAEHDRGWEEQAAGVLRQLETYRTQAAEIVGTIANTSMVGGFKEYADSQQRSADRWRWTSVAGALAAAGLAVWLLIYRHDHPFSWDLLVGKVLVVGLLGALAAYAGRESAAHRRREVTARRLQLELTAMDPYLASLTEERRAVIKEQVAQRIFGGPEPPSDAPGEPPAGLLTADRQQQLLDLAGQLQQLLRPGR